MRQFLFLFTCPTCSAMASLVLDMAQASILSNAPSVQDERAFRGLNESQDKTRNEAKHQLHSANWLAFILFFYFLNKCPIGQRQQRLKVEVP